MDVGAITTRGAGQTQDTAPEAAHQDRSDPQSEEQGAHAQVEHLRPAGLRRRRRRRHNNKIRRLRTPSPCKKWSVVDFHVLIFTWLVGH